MQNSQNKILANWIQRDIKITLSHAIDPWDKAWCSMHKAVDAMHHTDRVKYTNHVIVALDSAKVFEKM